MSSLQRRALAEAIGTFGFVFLCSAAAVADVFPAGRGGLVSVALVHGAALGLFISVTLALSGGHLNPAVTLGFLSTRRIDPRTAGAYILAQLAGAALAGLAVKFAFPLSITRIATLGTPALPGSVSFGRAVVLEAIGTFILVSAIYGTIVTQERPRFGGFGVGVALLALIIALGPLTGAAVNPARAFGPALASGAWTGQAIWWIGPILGAVVAAQLWEKVLMKTS